MHLTLYGRIVDYFAYGNAAQLMAKKTFIPSTAHRRIVDTDGQLTRQIRSFAKNRILKTRQLNCLSSHIFSKKVGKPFSCTHTAEFNINSSSYKNKKIKTEAKFHIKKFNCLMESNKTMNSSQIH